MQTILGWERQAPIHFKNYQTTLFENFGPTLDPKMIDTPNYNTVWNPTRV
jgi:hypothetical protein